MTTFYLDPEGGDDLASDWSHQNLSVGVTNVTNTAGALDFTAANSSRLSTPVTGTNGLQVGSLKFTAEGRFNFTSHSAAAVETMFGQWSDGASTGLSWRVGMNASGQLQFQWATAGTPATTSALTFAWTPTLGQWYHIAFDYDGTTKRLYVDGTPVASVSDTSAPFITTSAFSIGNDNSLLKRFPGTVQDFRFTRGVARYAGATFTPPAGPLPNALKDDQHWNNVMLLVPGRMDGSGTSFAQRWRTYASGATAARTAPGDTIRLRAAPEPTLIGDATWTQNSKTITLASAVTANIDTCDAVWTAATNVTATAVTSTSRREGSAFATLSIAAAFTTGKVAYKATGALDLSVYQQISFWFQSNTLSSAGGYRLVLCSDTTGDVPVKSIPLPAYAGANVWVPTVLDTGAALPSNVQSVALYADVDPGAGTSTVFLDNIIACKASSSPDSLTHRSLIGKVHNFSWAASTSYNLNDRRRPTQLNRNGFQYQVTSLVGARAAHRYWRVYITAAAVDPQGVEIAELEFYSTVGGASIATGGTAIADSEFLPASNAFDGGSGIWAPALTNMPHWIGYDFGAGNPKSLAQYGVTANSGSPNNYNPKDFKLQYSDDSTNWFDADSRTNQSWTSSQQRKFTLADATSGSTEPTWPAAWGKTVADGNLVWTCVDLELEDSWFPLTGINGTTLTLGNGSSDSFLALRGYHGATETVATYKRETTAAMNIGSAINEGGAAGSPITYAGGWSRTNMSAQDGGETWWDGINWSGTGLNLSSRQNIAISYLNAVRFSSGITATNTICTITNCHAVGCSTGIDLANSNLHGTLSGVHGFNCSASGVTLANAGQVFGRAVQGCNSASNNGVQPAKYRTRLNYVVAKNNGGVGIGAASTNVYDAIISNYATANNVTSAVYTGNSDLTPVCFVNGVSSEAVFINQATMGASNPVDVMLYSHKHGRDPNDHRIYFAEGTVRSDVSVRHTPSGTAWQCSITSSYRDSHYPVRFSLGRYLLQANVTKTFGIWTRRDAATMKGALLIYGGALAGIEDTVTASVDPSTLNTWEQSAGLSVTPTETGVVELWMLWWDGVGTTGNYWIDDLTVT